MAETSSTHFLSRHVSQRLLEALQDAPTVLIYGPRQCGKTTLANHIGLQWGYAYLTLDDQAVLNAAKEDPVGFVAELPERTIIDEVQRAPALFTALKAAVDRSRQPGRFILTGSGNVMLIPTLADSLAGRMALLRLHPLSQSELMGQVSEFIPTLFGAGFKHKPAARLGRQLIDRIVAGGFPAALARTTLRRQAAWYRDYIESLVQRDARDISRISSLDVLPRLLRYAAGQTGRLLNISDLAAPFQVSRPTIREYVTLLARLFLLEELPPWHSNQLSRLIKTPKIHLGDTGIACALMNIDAQALAADRNLLGQILETFVFQELRRQASAMEVPVNFFHFRDKDGSEVDIVLESAAQRIAGVEVKVASTVSAKDFNGLRKLKAAAAARFSVGVVLYDGEATLPFGEGLYGVPISALWQNA